MTVLPTGEIDIQWQMKNGKWKIYIIMSELTTYLKHLQYDPKLDNSLYAKYTRNIRLVILIIFLIIIGGVFSFLNIPRVLNPQVKIPIVIVTTSLPGASPKDIETLITIPIEDKLNSLQRVKTITSASQESASVITLEFESGVDPDKAKADVKDAVDGVQSLPKDAKTPEVQKLDFENTPVWTFTLQSKGDSLSLTRFSKTLRDALKDLPSIDKVDTSGLDNEEIQVIIKPTAITSYGINPATLSQTIQTAVGSFPGGSLSTETSSFGISLDPTVTTVKALRDLRISINGTGFLLSDIADIRTHTKPDTANSYIASNKQAPVSAIRFDVYKKSSANITQAVEDAKNKTNAMIAPYNGKFSVASIINTGEEIDKQFSELIRDLLITVGLVFLTLFIFLGIRQAIVASLAIPMTFLITFIVMSISSISLSFISFFSLLLSLGLLVDDTIVVVSALSAYYRTNKFTPFEAGMLVWRDFKTAIFTTTLTTVWAFVPLLLSTGIIGEFIKPIPVVVSSTLLASFAVAMFITLPIIVLLLQPHIPYRVIFLIRMLGVLALFGLFIAVVPKNGLFIPALVLFVLNFTLYLLIRYYFYRRARKQEPVEQQNESINEPAQPANGLGKYFSQGVFSFSTIGAKYRSLLGRILSTKMNRWIAVGAVVLFSVVSYLLVPLGLVRSEFFPKSDNEYMYVSLEMPSGTNLQRTNQEVLKILDDVRKLPDVMFASATLRLSIDPGRGYSASGDNNALITIVLPVEEKRKLSSLDIAQKIRDKYENYQAGKVSVVEVSGGPPAGADLQIKLFGDDLSVLDTYANKLQDYLKKQSGVANVTKTVKPGTSKIVFVPDSQKMIDAGVTQDQVGLWLRTFASGFTLSQDVRLQPDQKEKQDIVLRTSSDIERAKSVNELYIPTQHGPIPLNSIGDFRLKVSPSLITRENSKRTISVTASVTKGVSATEKNKELEKFADSLQLPEGYSWQTGGVNEENQRSVNSILEAMVLSFFLIIVTMVLQFGSFRKAFIVMLVIPLSISGVFIIFALTNTPLSFPALIGILALFGIVVKNSILVVDKINQNLKTQMSYSEAIIDAAESRLEPIALTSFAAIIGLIPITLSNPLWRGLGGAIIAGLSFSGTIMLFFIPVVYYLFFQSSEGKLRNNKQD